MTIRRLFLIRHGETEGGSSTRYFGSTDVDLSAEGRDQMREVATGLTGVPADLYLASTQRRSWRAAGLVCQGRPVRLERDLREIDFGQWEGLTREEIEARDPALFAEWQSEAPGFDYPGGEARAAFQERVGRAIDAALAAPGHTAVAVLHKGVIREIVRHLTGETLEADRPSLGEALAVTRRPDGSWGIGQRSSNPPGLEEAAA